MNRSKFLKAEWRKLIMANYKFDPKLLKDFLPAKTELDFCYNNCYVSLVGFMFQNVRVTGLKIPFHINFPEVNLRFYVKYKKDNEWQRGVVFIKEIVPKPVISLIANRFFYENYITLPMKYSWKFTQDQINVFYTWKNNGKWNKLEVFADSQPISLLENSHEEFITEHFWGYSSIDKQRTGEYQVDHPRWVLYPVKNYFLNCDFGELYGDAFADLGRQKPESIFLAEGSEIIVYKKQILI